MNRYGFVDISKSIKPRDYIGPIPIKEGYTYIECDWGMDTSHLGPVIGQKIFLGSKLIGVVLDKYKKRSIVAIENAKISQKVLGEIQGGFIGHLHFQVESHEQDVYVDTYRIHYTGGRYEPQ